MYYFFFKCLKTNNRNKIHFKIKIKTLNTCKHRANKNNAHFLIYFALFMPHDCICKYTVL